MEGNDSCLNHWKSEIMPEKKNVENGESISSHLGSIGGWGRSWRTGKKYIY